MDYSKWIVKHLPDKAELAEERKTKFSRNPKFSIVIPLYKTPEKYLQQLVDSIEAQTYGNWELCLSDGSGADSPLTDYLNRLEKSDDRIRVIRNDQALQIAENTNAAMKAATGDFIVFADHDDELTPDALFRCVKALNEDPELKVLYSDEDKMSMDGHKFFQPHFKPDFNIDLLCTVNYICHLFVVKKEIVDQIGMLKKEFDGAQDYDFVFRCVEAAGREQIHHIPRILYHWRCHEDSTAENPESKIYAFDAGARAIKAHYDRIGVPVEIEKGEYLGLYRTKFLWEEKPLISIIIPNKDHIDDLELCISSVEERSTWKNYEILVVENNSENKETFAYYEALKGRYDNVRILTWKKEFNYSSINNFAVKEARGEYLLFLNNDVEIITPSWIEEMLQNCQQDGVGITGAKLYYPDDTIQHAGVVVGLGGIAGHIMCKAPRETVGYMGRMVCVQEMSAVTAACMLVKASVFREVGGFDEELKVAFNDIDFCMKVRSVGQKVVFTPYAELYHYESKSRGLEDTPEKQQRFSREVKCFRRKWERELLKGDPYYSPNLSLKEGDCSLRKAERNGD